MAKKERVSKQSPARQADYVMKEVAQVGTSRKENSEVRGASIGALNDYRHHWQDAARWLQEVHQGGNAPKGFPSALHRMDAAAATQYLLEKACGVRQSQLDQARQSLEVMISHFSGAKVSLERIRSEVGQKGDLASGSRYYTKEQVEMIASAQTERNAVATRVAFEAGLRAHELGNIRRLEEAERAGDMSRRQFSEWRFVGAEHRTERYAVTGKGGITIEVRLSPQTAHMLEAFRREHPVQILDRGIAYWSRYDIGSGRAWSQSFRDASRRELGWSRGAHGLRHSYAQDRMMEIQDRGATWQDALHAVSNELAHLSPETTRTYLR